MADTACEPNADNAVYNAIDNLVAKADANIVLASQQLEGKAWQSQSFAANQGKLDATLRVSPRTSRYTGVTPDAVSLPGEAVPASPELEGIAPIDSGTLPEDTTVAPDSAMPAAPSVVLPEAPVAPDSQTDIVLPDPPVLDEVQLEALQPIPTITLTEIQIDDFQGTAPPVNSIEEPNATFSFLETDYTSDVLTQVEDRMNQMANNELGIPDSIWNLVWEQARERETEAVQQLVDETNIEWASRGFSLPTGIQIARIDKARQQALQKTISNSREQAIKHSQDKLDNFKFHVQQGIAFESLRGGWHENQMGRALDAAKYAFQADIELHNARISFFNARLELYKTELAVYQQEIQAEISKLEADKIKLENNKVISETNLVKVQSYKAQVEALGVEVDNYKAQVDAALATLELARTEAEIYASEIKGYTARVEAAATEYDLYKTQVEAKGIEFSAYETSVSAYGKRLDAYRSGIDAQVSVNNSLAAVNDNRIKLFDSQIKAYVTDVERQTKELETNVQLYQADLQKFQLEIQSSNAYNDSVYKFDQNAISYALQQTNANIQNAKQSGDISLANAQVVNGNKENLSQLYAGLAGSSMSAIGVSSGFSISQACTQGCS